MLPKKIHYCWFGKNPLPQSAAKYIDSWKKYFPDYEIIEWNEDNFDVNSIPYTREAYAAKKYAFVSDYARFKILYDHGGLYFDTDVEVIAPLDDIIAAGPFMGCENPAKEGASPTELSVAPGLGLGVNPGLGLYKEILDYYEQLRFVNPDGSFNLKTVVEYTTKILCSYGLKNTCEIQKVAGINVYPHDYFSPKSLIDGRIRLSDNTRTIHHYAGSWMSAKSRYGYALSKFIVKVFGVDFEKRLTRLYYGTKSRFNLP